MKFPRRTALALLCAAGAAACAPAGPRKPPAPEPRLPATVDSGGVATPPRASAAPDSQRAPGAVLRDVAEPRPALDVPPLPRAFRGLWVATVANLDWPSRPGLSTAEQQQELLAILDLAQRLRMNAVLLQVRPTADAIYPTALAPWSDYLTGEMGKPPEPYWDPLAFAVEEAHARGLELHAWFHSFRARSALAERPAAEAHVMRARLDLVRRYGRLLWLDPGEVKAQDLAVAAVLDVVLLDWWLAQDTLGRHVWPGLTPNRIAAKDHDWQADEVLEQVRRTRARSPRGACGHVL